MVAPWEQYIMNRPWERGVGGRESRPLHEYYSLGIPVENLRETPGIQPGYAPTNDSFLDELGFPSSLPGRHTSPLIQFMAERKVAARNADLSKQAVGQLRAGVADLQSGFKTLQAYRPGGVAGLASGMFQSMAQQRNAVAGGLMNSRTQAPDVMFEFDRHLLQRQQRLSNRASMNQLVGAGIGAVGSLAGGFMGGVGSAGGMSNFFAAKGGSVPPQPGGTQITVGEAGETEHIVPDSAVQAQLHQDKAQRAGGEARPSPVPMSGASGAPGPISREGGDAQRAGKVQDAAARAAAMQPIGEGYMGDALPRMAGDPGADGYGLPGASHFVSQRLGMPSDLIHALMRDVEFQGQPSLGERMGHRLERLVSTFDTEMV